MEEGIGVDEDGIVEVTGVDATGGALVEAEGGAGVADGDCIENGTTPLEEVSDMKGGEECVLC